MRAALVRFFYAHSPVYLPYLHSPFWPLKGYSRMAAWWARTEWLAESGEAIIVFWSTFLP